jgi:hypothetical protein
MRQHGYIRTVGIFVATLISTFALFAGLKNHFTDEPNWDSEVKFTSSIPSWPVARSASVQLIQARPDDAVAVLLVETRSRETPRALIPCRVRGLTDSERAFAVAGCVLRRASRA